MIYIIGSLANPKIPEIEKLLRASGFNVFAQWHAAGEHADEEWQKYFKYHGINLRDALKSAFVQNGFQFDKKHIDEADTVVVIAPFGKSGGIELGYAVGQGKHSYILFPNGDPERYDMMLAWADDIFYNLDELMSKLRGDQMRKR